MHHTETYCTILPHTAAHCNALHTMQHTVTHCNTLQRCDALQHIATQDGCTEWRRAEARWQSIGALWLRPLQLGLTCKLESGTDQCARCNTLQHLAAHYSTPQHTAAHCNTLHCNTLQHTAPHSTTLQHAALLSTTLHHTASRCNRLKLSDLLGCLRYFLQTVGEGSPRVVSRGVPIRTSLGSSNKHTAVPLVCLECGFHPKEQNAARSQARQNDTRIRRLWRRS